jgi:sulfur carrier protein
VAQQLESGVAAAALQIDVLARRSERRSFPLPARGDIIVRIKVGLMQVTVNGTTRDVAPETTLADLVAGFNLQPKHVAVEVNCDLVPRRSYPDTRINEGDRIEIVTLVGGG